MGTVTYMADVVDSGNYASVEQALQHSIDRMKTDTESAFVKGKKVIVICLDDTDGNYGVSFTQAGMKCSEMVALCEVFKQKMLREMGY